MEQRNKIGIIAFVIALLALSQGGAISNLYNSTIVYNSTFINSTLNGTIIYGVNGTNGINGSDGAQGAQGIQGIQGIPGVNGSSYIYSPIDYFFHDNNTMINIINYSHGLSTIINTSVNDGNTFITYYLSPELNTSFIPHGSASAHIESKKVGGINRIDRIYYLLYLTNSTGGNLTLLSQSAYSVPLTTVIFSEDIVSPITQERPINYTDRLLLEFYINSSGIGGLSDVYFYFDDLTSSRLIMPLHQVEEKDLIALAEINITNTNLQNNVTILNNNDNSKLNISGGTMTGILNMSINGITMQNISISVYTFLTESFNINRSFYVQIGNKIVPDYTTNKRLDYTSVARNSDDYLYYPYNISNFTLNFTFSRTSNSGSGLIGIGFGDTINNECGVSNGLYIENYAGAGQTWISHYTAGSVLRSAGTITTNNGDTRYISINRIGSSVTAYFFSDSAKTTQVSGSPLTYNDVTPTTFKYLYLGTSCNDGSVNTLITGIIDDFVVTNNDITANVTNTFCIKVNSVGNLYSTIGEC